jgi:hypothetical protein
MIKAQLVEMIEQVNNSCTIQLKGLHAEVTMRIQN